MKKNIKQELIDSCKTELEWETKRINKILQCVEETPINLVCQVFPMIKAQKDSFSVLFVAPLSFSLIDNVKLFMSEQFPDIELDNDHRYMWGNTATHYLTYKINKDVKFDFQFRSGEEGSTCKLNPIGKRNKEEVIYEVVCSQEAVNEFTLQEG